MTNAPPLPSLDFVVIGAYKAATTTLHLALRAHGDVFVPERKEPSYFAFCGLTAAEIDANPIAPIAVTDAVQYTRLFDDRDDERIAGEVSPEYLKNPRCAAELHTHQADAKLVAILRDPAERAFSDYLMYVRDGRETDSFASALGAQEQRLAGGLATGQYLITGRYGEQLQRYYERFDASQILVLTQDELSADRGATMGRLAAFLDVDPRGFEQTVDSSNISGVPTSPVSRAAYFVRRRLAFARNLVPAGIKRRLDARLQSTLDRPDLEAADREWLIDHYAGDIALTEELTGLDLSRWRTL